MTQSSRRLLVVGSGLLFAMIALATISGTAPANSSPLQVEKAVLARMNQIQAAGEGLNADEVFDFVLENDAGVIVQNGKVFLTRSNALESTRQNFQALQNSGARIQYRFDQQHVTMLSPRIALVVSEGTTSVTTAAGRNSEAQFAQSVLFVFTNGNWNVLHAHRSFVQAPQQP